MAANRIEREIRIDAPIDVVWSVVTEPEQITRWFSDGVDLELEPGAAGTLTFGGSRKGSRPDGEAEAVILVRVERMEPPRYFSFRWNYPLGSDPDERSAPLVEFILTADGEATTLKVVESWVKRPEVTADENDRYFADHNRGWDHHLGLLRTYVEHQLTERR